MDETIQTQTKKTVLIKSTKSLVDDMNKLTSRPSGILHQTDEMENTEKALNTIFEDEEVQGFYGSIIDKMVEAGYTIQGSKTAIEQAKKKLEEYRFNKHLKKWFFILATQKKAFVELVKNNAGTSVASFYEQPTHRMAPIMDEHGNILKYTKYQINGEYFDFNKEDIALLSVEEFTYNFWDVPQIQTLEKLIRLKNLVMENIYNRFYFNMFKTHLHFQGLSKEDIEDMGEILKLSPEERNKFLFTIGELPLEPHKLDDEASILPLLELIAVIRNKMLTLIRVPPIIAGTVDDSNRSNSDVQARFAFTSRINSLMMDIYDEINYNVLPSIGLSNVKLIPGTVDIKEDSEYITMAQQMIAMNCDRSKVEEWLKSKGLDIPDGLFTIPPEQMPQESASGSNSTNPSKPKASTNPLQKNSKLYPSRQPQDKGISNHK